MVWQTLKSPESFTTRAGKGTDVPGDLQVMENRHGKHTRFSPSLLQTQIRNQSQQEKLGIDHSLI